MKAVNLLPSEQRGSQKTSAPVAVAPAPGSSPFGAYVVLGVLAFLVAALAVYTLAGNVVKDRKAELARVTTQTQQAQAAAGALQAYADFKTLAQQRVDTVKGLADSRFDWERTLGDLSRAVPGDVHLTSLTGTVGTQVSGASSGPLRGAIQAPALELQGCTGTQSSVARMMSRLRIVRGVTRVSLAKSDKDGSTTTASSSTDPNLKPAQLCPKGAPPSFDVVLFFERAAVDANAVPNAATATATTGAASAAATPTPTPAAGSTTAASSTTTTPATTPAATPEGSTK